MPESDPTYSRRIGRADRGKIAAVALASLAIVAFAAVAVGADPAPSSGAAASSAASAKPDSSAKTRDADKSGNKGGGFGRFGGGGGIGRGGIEITAISGSNVSLKTVDGWTRTIAVTPETEITKGGQTIAVGDLEVGDEIRFRQQRNDDGTYTITKIVVILPSVWGTVTGKTDSTITIELRGGTTATIHVDASTTYRVEDVEGTADLGDVAVEMRILATGETRADGSLDASSVLAGTGRIRDHDKNDRNDKSEKSPAPSSSANPG